jgi:hypothetical protein
VATRPRAGNGPIPKGTRPTSDQLRGDRQSDAVSVFYEELVRSRDRLAELSPATPQEIERVFLAMHEVIWYLITPPRGVRTALPLSEATKASLLRAARDRDLDLYVMTVALVSEKLALTAGRKVTRTNQLDELKDALDALTFDYRVPKKVTLSLLRELKAEVDNRISYARAQRPDGYRFQERPESYRNREAKTERPDQSGRQSHLHPSTR